MATIHPALLAGAGTLVGAAAVVGRNAFRERKRRRALRMQEAGRALARVHGLEWFGERVSPDLLEAAGRFRSCRSEAVLRDVLAGKDDEGRYWMALRRIGKSVHHVLCFEIRGELGVRGLHLEPVARGDVSPRRWAPWRRKTSARSATVRLRVRWESDTPSMADPQVRQSVDRWIAGVATRCRPGRQLPLGLEVHGSWAWVHTMHPLEGTQLAEFLRAALALRREVLGEVRRRPATVSAATTHDDVSQALARRQAKEDTRPLFPVAAADSVDDDPSGRTIRLSAEELLRELPDPQPKRRRRTGTAGEFEIPEPDEEVVLIKVR